MNVEHAAPKHSGGIKVFLIQSARDRILTPTRTFSLEHAQTIIQDTEDQLRADEVAEIRWPYVIAQQILSRPSFDDTSAAMAVALSAIDRRPLGRINLDEVREILVRIDHVRIDHGVVSIACVDDPVEREIARRRLFENSVVQLAA